MLLSLNNFPTLKKQWKEMIGGTPSRKKKKKKLKLDYAKPIKVT